ncbi:MAG: Fic family protein [Candidatus Aminicenantales bacterium]
MTKNRAGRYLTQLGGYKAFIPNPLPPSPSIKYDEQLQFLLSEADRTLARLDGVALILPNPDLFIAMYTKKEALLSSQIEGTQASLEGLLAFEADLTPKEDINEIKEVVNYVKAINYGMDRLKKNDFPMSLRLIKEIHKILLKGVRGTSRRTGEFRRSQNWIGPPGCTINEAIFIPPPHNQVDELMSDLEKFIHEKDNLPPLVKIGLIHAQFETIHPFLDGNGRIGRLLITFYLFWRGFLIRPLLYLSIYLKKYREKYYDYLMRIRTEGDWEGWLKFFLQGVIEVSVEAASSVKEIIGLKNKLTNELFTKKIGSTHAVKLLDILFERPLISISDIERQLKISRQTATNLANRFNKMGILKEVSGKKRYRKYLFVDYMNIISRGTEIEPG